MKEKLKYFLFPSIFSILFLLAQTTQSESAEEALTEDRIRVIFSYIKERYSPIIERLRAEVSTVTRSEILRLYRNDTSLHKADDGGHNSFRHIHFPFHCGVLGRDDRLLDPGEKKDTWRALQVYVNTIKIHVLKFDEGVDYAAGLVNYLMVKEKPELFSGYLKIEDDRFEEYTRK